MNKITNQQVEETAAFLTEKLGGPPSTAVVLGSGLGSFIQNLKHSQSYAYAEVPHLITSKVVGHSGKITVAELEGTNGGSGGRTAFLEGRLHFYEGYSMQQIAYPVYALKAWGVRTLILTNAAGSINRDFSPGDLMLITDHINLMGSNPLIGPHDQAESLGPRFQDLSEPYSRRLLEIARQVARQLGIAHREGVYAAWTGPAYETAAEIRFLSVIGADAVGMSTVPEAIAANHAGLELLAISCITNMATGISSQAHEHERVLEVARKSSEGLCRWMEGIIPAVSDLP